MGVFWGVVLKFSVCLARNSFKAPYSRTSSYATDIHNIVLLPMNAIIYTPLSLVAAVGASTGSSCFVIVLSLLFGFLAGGASTEHWGSIHLRFTTVITSPTIFSKPCSSWLIVSLCLRWGMSPGQLAGLTRVALRHALCLLMFMFLPLGHDLLSKKNEMAVVVQILGHPLY